jgi:hypothetical protein
MQTADTVDKDANSVFPCNAAGAFSRSVCANGVGKEKSIYQPVTIGYKITSRRETMLARR